VQKKTQETAKNGNFFDKGVGFSEPCFKSKNRNHSQYLIKKFAIISTICFDFVGTQPVSLPRVRSRPRPTSKCSTTAVSVSSLFLFKRILSHSGEIG
jgi:hypothetical protein